MSKKHKRKNHQPTQPRETMSVDSGTKVQKFPDNFNPDYTYVKQDLQNIGILAGIFITILIILSFFL